MTQLLRDTERVFLFKFKRVLKRISGWKIFSLCLFSICISCTSPTTSVMENSGKRDNSNTTKTTRTSENYLKIKLDNKYLRKMRVQQNQLCKISDDFNKHVKKNRNIAFEKLITQLTYDIDGLLPRGKFEDWVMLVEEINNLENNTKTVVLTPQCSLRFVGKVNSQDLFLKELKKGSSVLASGSIVFPPITKKVNDGQIYIDYFSVILGKKFDLSQR